MTGEGDVAGEGIGGRLWSTVEGTYGTFTAAFAAGTWGNTVPLDP